MRNAEPNLKTGVVMKESRTRIMYIYNNSWGRWIIPNQLLLGVDESFRTKGPVCVL
jgi:hypothetical protein